jgi:hypothetical protein
MNNPSDVLTTRDHATKIDSPGPSQVMRIRHNILAWAKRGIRAALPLLAIFAFLSIIYVPCCTGYYIHHDDITNWYDAPGKTWFKEFDSSYLCDVGRPLGAKIKEWGWMLADNVSQANRLRILSLLGLALTGFLFQRLAVRYHRDEIHTTILAATAMTLPAFSILALFATCLYITVGLLAGMFAAYLCQRESDWFRPGRRLVHLGIGAVAAIFIVFGLLCHQATAMIYWAPMALPVLYAPGTRAITWIKRLWFPILVGIIAMCAYFVYIRLAPQNRPENLSTAYNSRALASDLPAKARWFFGTILPMVLNGWLVATRTTASIVVAISFAVVSSTLAIRSIVAAPAGSRWRLLGNLALNGCGLIAIMLFCFAPSLVSAGYATVYRCFVGLSLLLLICVFKCLDLAVDWIFSPSHRRAALTIVLLVLGWYGSMHAEYNIVSFVQRDTAELLYIEACLSQKIDTPVSAICLVRPPQLHEGLEEYFFTTSMSNGHGMALVRAAMDETGHADLVARMPVTTSEQPIPTGVHQTQAGPMLFINVQSLSHRLFDVLPP